MALATGALLLAVVAAEVLLRARPSLLPAWYLGTLPESGIELFEPGVLSRTPLEGVPLPRVWRRGVRPPADLAWNFGLFPLADNPDLLRWPELIWPRDALGLPNPPLPERVDLTLVGDSYAFWAGLQSPPGLVARLTGRTGLTVHDLGVIAIGPHQERWLLEHVGLAREPRAVVWLFFGGNDVQDAGNLQHVRAAGARMHSDRGGYRPPPLSLLLDLLRQARAPGTRAVRPEPPRPVPPVVLPGDDGGPGTAFWMAPPYMRSLVLTRDEWRRHGGWEPTGEVLRGVRDLLAARGIPWLLVYAPSKAQVYLPLLSGQDEALHAMAFHETGGRTAFDADTFVRRAARNADEQEHLLAGFCADEGIAFLSLTPILREHGRRGVMAYMAGDSHWGPLAQELVLPALIERVTALLADG